MGVPWVTQVRLLHLVIISVAVITTILICLSYLNTSLLLSTPPSPIRSLMTPNIRIFQGNTSGDQQRNGGGAAHNIVNKLLSSSEAPPIQQQQQQHQNITNSNNNQPDLTRGVAAETIYESGHKTDANAQQLCPDMGKKIKLLIAITSAPSHETARIAIRETWGHYAIRNDVAIAFMLGSINNSTINDKIEQEQQLYGDIIRGKFIDTYDNLTLKTISMLEWVDNYCPKAAYVLKTDDDMFINVSRLLSFIAKHNYEQRTIYGRLAKKWKPIRNKKSKYYISLQQYKPAVFPDFTTGPAYLLPAHLSKELYTAALNHTYFKLEDVFVTGIVANGLKIKRVHAPEFLNKRVSFTACNIQRGISFHMVKSGEQYDLWKKLHDVAKCKK